MKNIIRFVYICYVPDNLNSRNWTIVMALNTVFHLTDTIILQVWFDLTIYTTHTSAGILRLMGIKILLRHRQNKNCRIAKMKNQRKARSTLSLQLPT